MILFALFKLAFASAPWLHHLTSHHIVTRRPVLQKVRYHTISSAISACKHTVSGSFSLPSRGSFHLSLTVLYSIGHMVVFSLRRWSSYLPSGFLVSRRTPDTARFFALSDTGVLPSLPYLSRYLLLMRFLAFRGPLPHTYFYIWFGLFRFRSPLLSESIAFFLFLRVMRCFSSPGSPDSTIDSYYRNTTLLVLSSLIRISADLRSFATPHSFSQLVTSFFGAMYQGILLYALCSLIFSWYISISPSFILDSYKKIQNKLCYTFFRINLILSCMNICLFLPSVL